jgi:hypothetical protein
MRPLSLLAVFCLAAGALAGCGQDEPAVVVRVDWDRPATEDDLFRSLQGSVEFAAGETALVDFGTTNSSVGDRWVLQDGYDTAVVTAEPVENVRHKAPPDHAGVPSETSARIKAVAPGTTTVTYGYSYRGKELISYDLLVEVR